MLTTDLARNRWHNTGTPRPPQSDNTVIYTVSYDTRNTRLASNLRQITSVDKQGRILRQLINKTGNLGSIGATNFILRLPGGKFLSLARDGNTILVGTSNTDVLLTGAILTIKKKIT